MVQRIAIPVWNGWVSPVFDVARTLLVVDAQAGREVSRRTEILGQGPPPVRAKMLKDLGVDVLLCGGISRPLAGVLAAEGIQVVPWLSGPADQVLQAFLSGRIWRSGFFMPGCPGPHRRRLGRRWRWGSRGWPFEWSP